MRAGLRYAIHHARAAARDVSHPAVLAGAAILVATLIAQPGVTRTAPDLLPSPSLSTSWWLGPQGVDERRAQRFTRRADPAGRAAVHAAVVREAAAQGVPVAFALAVTQQESGFNPRAIGPLTPHSGGERAMGPLQVLPRTARGMGHTGSPRDLMRPEVGARYGVRYMANALRECGGDIECAARRYHGGPNRRIWGRRTIAYGRAVIAHTRRYGGAVTAQARLPAGCPTADDRFPHTWGCR